MHEGPEDSAEAWSQLLAASTIRPADRGSIRFTGMPSEARDGSLYLAVDPEMDVWVDVRSATLVEAVAERLAGIRVGSAVGLDLRVVLLRHIADLLRDARSDRSWQALYSRAEGWTRQAVVSVALGGVFSSASAPLSVGSSAVLGHLNRETEDAVASLARLHGLHGFRFTHGAWWTEQFLHAEADAAFAAELAEAESLDETWQPLVLAVVVPAVGSVATWRAVEIAEAVAGVLATTVQSDNAWLRPRPWVLGQATLSTGQREPKLDENGLLSCIPLQVDTLPMHELHGYSTVEGGELALNVDAAVALEDPVVSALVTALCDDQGDERLVGACRLINAAVALPSDLGAVLLQRATLLLSENNASLAAAITQHGLSSSLIEGSSESTTLEDLRRLLVTRLGVRPERGE